MENQLSIALSKNKLLKNADISKIDLTSIKGKLITAGEGEILYREGDNSDSIFLVVSGEVNVVKKRLLGKTKSYVFVEDDFFGNEEYYEETSRTSTAVALRDSYLISLSKDEIELLISREHQIYLNLREPAEEMEVDFPRIETKTTSSEADADISRNIGAVKIQNTFANSSEAKDEIEKPDDEFFKSIAGVSRAEEANIIQPSDVQNNENDNFEMISFDEDESKAEDFFENGNNVLNEDGIPKAEFDLSEMQNDPEEKQEAESSTFDESVFLNEDGIPKAEFEIPDTAEELKKLANKTNELDDALFNILSGGSEQFEIPKAEQEKESLKSLEENPAADSEQKEVVLEKSNSEDSSFFAAFADDKHEIYDVNGRVKPEELDVRKEDFESKFELSEEHEFKFEEAKFSESPQVQYKAQPNPEEEANAQPYKKHFDNEDILAEADEKLRKVERGEPVSRSDNWRTISDAGGEMNSEQLQMIIKAAEFVNSTVKIDEVLANVVKVATSLTNADRGTLFLIDREKSELWSLIAMGSESKEIRLKIGEGLAGYVALSGDVINIKDVQTDPRFKSDFDKASGYKTKNMLCYPIRNNKYEIIGVLQLLNSNNGEFSKLDENFLNAISIHSAIALQNAAMVDKLLQTERVQSLGKMANFLIQDIKKPVLVSKRYAEHLKTKTLTQDVAQVIDMLLEQLSQVVDIVQTTSSYSEGKPVLRTLNVSLNNTLADYASRIASFVESRNCQIITEYDKDVTVKLDVKEFYQCFVHIIKNACDAMTEGGSINVYTKRDDKRVKIFFKDSGLGIPDGFKDKIFEPFMSYGKKEGTGLGLSITRKVVEAHNATIDVQSSLGQGALFIISLPVAASF